jgi:hypothetical protein
MAIKNVPGHLSVSSNWPLLVAVLVFMAWWLVAGVIDLRRHIAAARQGSTEELSGIEYSHVKCAISFSPA